MGWRGRAEIEALYAGAEVLVVPSRWEALGLVALEAMRAGLPVVASRVGGLAEVVEDHVTGRLIEPDNPALLAEVLAGLDAGTRRRMGELGRDRYLQRFQVARLVDELDEAYASAALSGARARPGARALEVERP